MIVHIYRANGARSGDYFIPTEWPNFWLCICLGFLCLIISAYFAKLRIGSFPANPLYWHYWLIANADSGPLVNNLDSRPRIYRPYMLFWAGSIASFVFALVVLLGMLSK